jgi:hypothetical protein
MWVKGLDQGRLFDGAYVYDGLSSGVRQRGMSTTVTVELRGVFLYSRRGKNDVAIAALARSTAITR